MAVAGKVAPVPKGNWASDVEYEKLNLVKYNNKLFIAKQASTNRTPVGDASDQYWMLSLEGITSVFTGATAQTAGTAGLVPAPSAGDQNKLVRGDGSWGYAKIEEVKPTTGATAGQIPIAREVGGAIQFQMEDVPSSGHGILNQNGTLMTQEENLQFLYADVTDVPEHEEGAVTIPGKTTVDGRGHKLKNASGTDMVRRESLQFTDGLEATDDSQGAKTKVGMNLPIVPRATWDAMTEQEKTAYIASHYRFGVELPDTEGVINAEYMKLLWENPNTTQSFASQTITLNSADYDFYIVVAKHATSYDYELSEIAPKGNGCWLSASHAGSGGTITYRRAISRVSDTSLNIDNCATSTGTTAYTTNNAYLVPVAVYGIKASFQFKVNAIASNLSTRADHCFLDDGVTTVEECVADTGWLESNSLKYRKIGSCVWIKGTISGSTGGAWSGITTLPVGFRPSANVQLNLFSNDANYANIAINTNGYVEARTNVGSIPYMVSFLID